MHRLSLLTKTPSIEVAIGVIPADRAEIIATFKRDRTARGPVRTG
jgi:hypothetical protein